MNLCVFLCGPAIDWPIRHVMSNGPAQFIPGFPLIHSYFYQLATSSYAELPVLPISAPLFWTAFCLSLSLIVCLPGFTFQSFFAPLTVLVIAALELSFVLGLLTFKTINIWTVPTLVLFCAALGTISRSTTCSWCTLPSTEDSWRRLYQQARLWVQEKR